MTADAITNWTEYSRFLTALLVILNPFAAVPILLALTRSYTARERLRIANMAALTVLMVLVVSALSGEALLQGMGTSLASFRVGGGIVLLLMALSMLQAQPDMTRSTPAEHEQARDMSSIGVVPLGIPLLAGPGSISTVVIEMHRSAAAYHEALVIGAIAAVCVVLWLVLRMASVIGKLLGPIGLNIINRLFGLILAAIAVEIMSNGLRQLFPGLLA